MAGSGYDQTLECVDKMMGNGDVDRQDEGEPGMALGTTEALKAGGPRKWVFQDYIYSLERSLWLFPGGWLGGELNWKQGRDICSACPVY